MLNTKKKQNTCCFAFFFITLHFEIYWDFSFKKTY